MAHPCGVNTVVTVRMTTMKRRTISTFIVELESDAVALPYTPLFLKYDASHIRYFNGVKVPIATNTVEAKTDSVYFILAGIVLPVQPAQTLRTQGLATVATCVRGPCTALLRPPDAPAGPPAAPGDDYYYGTVFCGTVIAETNTVYQTKSTSTLAYTWALVFITEYGIAAPSD